MCLHISHILKVQNGISVLNVSAGFIITLCGPNLNYEKTKQNCDLTTRATKLSYETNFLQGKRKR